MTDLQSYLDNAEAALKQLLTEWRPKLMASHGSVSYDLKEDKSVVTELDGNLELAIKDVLRPLSDEVGFLGEEHGPEGPQDVFWTLDPIDGTEQYVRGMPSCRTLLCLIADGKPQYAIAYRFTTDEMFIARAGKGVYRNDQKLQIEPPRELHRQWVEISISKQEPRAVAIMQALRQEIGSICYTHEFLNAVEGFIDAYIVINSGGKVWDYAPRALLLAESGLKVTNLGSEDYDYNNLSILAAHPDNYDWFAERLSLLA